jgi:high-affinity K+ transport system ATPase subunit B
MSSQILLLVIAIAVCANAYPQSRELGNDLTAFLGQLEVWLLFVYLIARFALYLAESKITAESFSVLTISLYADLWQCHL